MEFLGNDIVYRSPLVVTEVIYHHEAYFVAGVEPWHDLHRHQAVAHEQCVVGKPVLIVVSNEFCECLVGIVILRGKELSHTIIGILQCLAPAH